MNRDRILLPGKGINCYLVCYHECGIESQSKMTDDLILICLVLIFLQEIRRTGKCNLIDILLNLSLRHTDTGIGK